MQLQISIIFLVADMIVSKVSACKKHSCYSNCKVELIDKHSMIAFA